MKKSSVDAHGAQLYSHTISLKHCRIAWIMAQMLTISHSMHLKWKFDWICQVSHADEYDDQFMNEHLKPIIFSSFPLHFRRSTSWPIAVPRFAIQFPEIRRSSIERLCIESISWPHTDCIPRAHLRHTNTEFHRFCCARCHFDHYFLLVGCANVGCYVDRTKRRNAGALFGVRHHGHRVAVLACCNTIRHHVRSNNVCADF